MVKKTVMPLGYIKGNITNSSNEESRTNVRQQAKWSRFFCYFVVCPVTTVHKSAYGRQKEHLNEGAGHLRGPPGPQKLLCGHQLHEKVTNSP